MTTRIFFRTIITTMLMLFFLSGIFADTITNKTKPVLTTVAQPKEVTISQPTVHTPMTGYEAYKLLYENAKDSNNRMITTLQWVMGLSIAFLLAIATGQFLFNHRINKKEIDFIKKDIEERIGELKAVLIRDIAETHKEQDSIMRGFLDKIEKESKEKINEQYAKQTKIAELNDKMKEREIDLIQKEMDSEIKKLKSDINKNEGDIWKLKGVESNALTSYLNTAFLQIELGSEIKYILNDIISILEKREEIHQSDYNQLDKLISKLTSKNNDQKEKIISVYQDKPVYRYVDRPSTLGLDNIYAFGGFGLSGKEYVKNKPKK